MCCTGSGGISVPMRMLFNRVRRSARTHKGTKFLENTSKIFACTLNKRKKAGQTDGQTDGHTAQHGGHGQYNKRWM